jgi:hypothetical protein
MRYRFRPRRRPPGCLHHFASHPAKKEGIGTVEVLDRVTMQVFVCGDCTMIAASVQSDVDGIPKGSHYMLLKRANEKLTDDEERGDDARPGTGTWPRSSSFGQASGSASSFAWNQFSRERGNDVLLLLADGRHLSVVEGPLRVNAWLLSVNYLRHDGAHDDLGRQRGQDKTERCGRPSASALATEAARPHSLQ